MNIRINVKNSSVDFSNQEITLDRNGVYLMKGPNGIGKTSILKDIVLSRKFDDHNRNHFAYAEQGPEKYNISICDYLKRFNSDIDVEKMHKLLEKLDLAHLDIKSSLLLVSGGELVKLNIIACLIKNTEYVFLDEPTNNLDDASVEALIEVIKDMAQDRVIVLVSHDPRITSVKSHIIEVKHNKIEVSYAESMQDNSISNRNIKKIKYPLGKIIRRHFGRFSSIVNISLLLIYTFAIIYFNNIIFQYFYYPAELTNKDDTILVYSVEMEYGEINQRYAESTGIKVDDNKYYSMIQYSDIPAIVDEYNVEDIYIENDVYADYLADIISERMESTDSVQVSIPYIVLENYIMQINPYFSMDYLLEGRYPYDGKKEIVLSQAIIDSKYPNKNINDVVLFDGEEYVLVGIHYLDIYMISYSGNSDYFYKYSSKTYEEFVEEQVNYKKSIDAPESYIYKPLTIVIQAENGKEDYILKSLFVDYPANNYYSYSYANDIADYDNAKLIKWVWIGNIVAVSVLGLFFILVNRKRCEIYSVEAESLDNYYLSKPLSYRILSISELILSLVIYVISIVIGKNVSIYNIEFIVICVSCSVLFVAASVLHMKILLKGRD